MEMLAGIEVFNLLTDRLTHFRAVLEWLLLGGRVSCPGKVSALWGSSSSFHRSINVPLTPKLRSAAAQLELCSTTTAIASCLNSQL